MHSTRLMPLLAMLSLAVAACSAGPEGPEPFGSGGGNGRGGGVGIDAIPTDLTSADTTPPEVDEDPWLVPGELVLCPAGAAFDGASNLCVAQGQALGPFPAAMIAECKKLGGTSCEADRMPIDLARRARGGGECSVGADVDAATGLCADASHVYGPFDLTLTKQCRLAGGGAQCDTLRWEKRFAPLLVSDEEGGGITLQAVPRSLSSACGSNGSLFNYYKDQQGFMNVRRSSRAKLRQIGASSASRPDRNGCATYLSYALRQSGAIPNMPIHPGTEEFRDELLRRGWKVIRNPADFRPGDVIISRDRAGVPGHPDHVYMYAGSVDGQPGMGHVIDNQGAPLHTRNVSVSGRKTRAAYALRAPDAKGECAASDEDAPSPDSCSGKSDGWYCSDLRAFSAYKCQNAQILTGFQCASNQVCSRGGDNGRAVMAGQNPACQGGNGDSTKRCASDGQCNPGSQGSGHVCTAGTCVPGCRRDYHCPGVQRCSAGACR